MKSYIIYDAIENKIKTITKMGTTDDDRIAIHVDKIIYNRRVSRLFFLVTQKSIDKVMNAEHIVILDIINENSL